MLRTIKPNKFYLPYKTTLFTLMLHWKEQFVIVWAYMDGLANTDKKEKYSQLLFMVQKPCDQDLVTVVRKTIIKTSQIINVRDGMKKREPFNTIVRNVNIENSIEVPQNIKNRTIIWFSNPILGHISGQNYNLKIYMHFYVYSGTIYNSQDMKTT